MARKTQRTTIVEVARAAGVSTTTVSVVLNESASTVRISAATRAAVKAAAAQLGYMPNPAAQSLRRQHTHLLTLLVGGLANPFFTDIAASVRAHVAVRGYELHIVDAYPLEAELQALDLLRNGSSAGVIVATGRHGARGQAIDALRELVRSGLPAVIVCDRSPDPAIPAIRIDDQAGAAVVTSHLLRLGHRHIAHLTSRRSHLPGQESTVEADRFQGYLRALMEAGVAYDPAWLVQGEPTVSGGYAQMHELLARPGPRPTAVFCISDLTAIGALRALYELGIPAPEGMAVVGFDGILLGQFTNPALTTIDQPRAEMGRLAAEMLFHLLEGREPQPSEQLLAAELLVRESCGAAARIKAG
jgi:LacI family transcriptional regulator, repressor for deo operon, udp, cdd, tsx, nupC, and nupG